MFAYLHINLLMVIQAHSCLNYGSLICFIVLIIMEVCIKAAFIPRLRIYDKVQDHGHIWVTFMFQNNGTRNCFKLIFLIR